ncbi:glycosyltransferase family 4 protein [Vibrio parahaemolyticus]|uniref:glycosyltransferase family 4 protein n=1 Tax=Vibrio parahaemolyticus TaxID=670 RepID=UPI00226BA3A8|nr:glycosyltransferase family 4 protein [Vibrio parahaemolyticus]MCX8773897.1 glycosyltransferase family 4 protein [Vibrio parahaemolyticus]
MNKRQKKIVIVSFTFFPEINGVANVALNHAKFLSEDGYDVEIITGKSNLIKKSNALPDEVKVTRFNIGGSLKLHDFIRGDVKKCVNYINGLNVDAVYFHAWESWSTDICLFFNNSKRKMVIFSHGISYKSNFGSFSIVRKLLLFPYRFVIPFLIKKTDKLVLLSDMMDNDRFYDSALLSKKGIAEKKVVIPNFCPNFSDEFFGDDLKHLELPSDYYVCVSNFQDIKNQEELITLVSKIPSINLVLVGGYESKYYYHLERLAKELRVLDRIKFVVGLSHKESMDILRKAKAFILSSKTECFPLCVLESISLNVPVISSNVGCLKTVDSVLIYDRFNQLVDMVKRIETDNEYYSLLKINTSIIKEEYSELTIKKRFLSFTEDVTND